MNYLTFIFAFIYIIIDVFYIVKSNSFYDNSVRKIQGSSMNNTGKKGVYVSGIIAYTILAIGWIYFIASKIESHISYKDLVILCIIYALCIYGVFNATLYSMFKNWGLSIALRDTIWGISSITLFSIFYKLVVDNLR